jgi:hypothetical protein
VADGRTVGTRRDRRGRSQGVDTIRCAGTRHGAHLAEARSLNRKPDVNGLSEHRDARAPEDDDVDTPRRCECP